MRCDKCGTESPESTRFCVSCGAPVGDAGAQGATASGPTATKTGKKRRGCRTGCLVVLAVVLVLAGLVAIVIFDVPTRLGLVKPASAKLLGSTPDTATAQVLEEGFARSGQATEGVFAYVMPIQGKEYALAYVILDSSQGYAFADIGKGNPIADAFAQVGRSPGAKNGSIGRVAVEYRDEKGATLFVMTAPIDAVRGFADGSLTEEQFFEQADGKGDLAKLTAIQLEWVGGLQ